MSEVENNVKVSWQLVSQFVSWEFCRYMCEQSEKENDKVENDVLTFLRNMIVERTEKAASDVTKHEIVAKFVMETRTIQKASRMSCITTLSESLVRICPELKGPVATLLPRLEGLLRVLEWNENSDNRELVQFSIVEVVNDFTKEACKVLPLPDLPQVVEPWLHPESQGQRPKVKYKSVTNVELYQKAVNCLREEKISPTEAKIIAELLYGDKELETLFQNFSETETDVDSQQQSHSLPSSHPPPLSTTIQQSLKLSDENRFNSFMRQTELPHLVESLSLDASFSEPPPSKTTSKCPKQYGINEEAPENTSSHHNKLVPDEPICAELLDSDPDFLAEPITTSKPVPVDSRISDSSPVLTAARKKNRRKYLDSDPELEAEPIVTSKPVPVDSRISDSSPVLTAVRKKNRRKYLEFIQFVEDSSEDENNHSIIPDLNSLEIPVSELQFSFLCSHSKDDEADTSDCDKNGEVRFLTPTMFKEDYVPPKPPSRAVWLSDESNESSIVTTLVDSQKNDPNYKSHARFSPVLPKKKTLKVAAKRSKKTQLQSNKSPKAPRQATLRGFGFSSATTTEKTRTKNGTARKRPFKLFDNDLMPKNLDESALFQKKEPKKKPSSKQKGENLGNRRRCTDCQKTFRTPLELKKHVFIEHTMEDLSD